MKTSIELRRQRIEKLLNDKSLVKALIGIFLLLAITLILFGVLAGSVFTTYFFPNTHF